MTKIYGFAAAYYMYFLHNCAISIDSYSPVNKFYSFILFNLLINACYLVVLF